MTDKVGVPTLHEQLRDLNVRIDQVKQDYEQATEAAVDAYKTYNTYLTDLRDETDDTFRDELQKKIEVVDAQCADLVQKVSTLSNKLSFLRGQRDLLQERGA